MVSVDHITHPEQLQNGRRYHVWYLLSTSKTKSGTARGAFSDVFKELNFDGKQCYLHFYEQDKLDWRHVTCIQECGPRG